MTEKIEVKQKEQHLSDETINSRSENLLARYILPVHRWNVNIPALLSQVSQSRHFGLDNG